MSNSIKLRTAICAGWSLFILFSCAKGPTKVERTPTSTFPLTTDSRWEYSATWYQIPFNDPSLADTVTRDIYRHIIGPDSLPGIADLTVCDDTIITSASGVIDTFINRQWLKLENDSLKLFAADNYQYGNEPTPEIYDNPHILLDLPLSARKEWLSWEGGMEGSSHEGRRIAGVDYIEIPGGWLYCDVVFSAVVNPSLNDTLFQAFEWYDDAGLMHYEGDFGVSEKTDENGLFLDSVTTYEFWELIDLDIRP